MLGNFTLVNTGAVDLATLVEAVPNKTAPSTMFVNG
jgi:hypothetical protein